MNPPRFLKTLRIIHLSLVVGLGLFTAVAFFQNSSFNADINANSNLLYIVPVVALFGYFGSQLLFKRMLDNVKKSDSLERKLNQYQIASIIKYALIEGPACIALFVYLVTGNALPLVIAGCLLAYLFVQRPTKNRISNRLSLSSEEQRTFDSH
jgi:ABC-type proline/glycine betaine transport system permease subunit